MPFELFNNAIIFLHISWRRNGRSNASLRILMKKNGLNSDTDQ